VVRSPTRLPGDADLAFTADALTDYDVGHRTTYLRLHDAEAEGADWREVARAAVDPEREAARARAARGNHLAWGESG